MSKATKKLSNKSRAGHSGGILGYFSKKKLETFRNQLWILGEFF
jgi:hypothetical protein